MSKRITTNDFFMTLLNGVAIGSVVVLIPSAFLSELVKALLPYFPALEPLLHATLLSNSLMGVVIGIVVGYKFNFTPVEYISIGLATQFASGAVIFQDSQIILQGTGDILSMMFTSAIGAGLIFLIRDKVKTFSLLVIPVLEVGIVSMIGYLALPHILKITSLIGLLTEKLLTMQPLLVAIALCVLFAFLILSPITTVGLALAISLSGVGSGAANLGITAAAIGYSLMGWQVNNTGVNLAIMLGSPKIAMPVIARNVKTFIPILSTSIVLGVLASIFNIVGTPMSAGFGISGFIGPLNHINLTDGGYSLYNIVVTIGVFIIAPFALTLLFRYLFTQVIPIVSEEDYKIDIET